MWITLAAADPGIRPAEELLVSRAGGASVLPTWQLGSRRVFSLEDLLRLQPMRVNHQGRLWELDRGGPVLRLFEDSRLMSLGDSIGLLEHPATRTMQGLLLDLGLLDDMIGQGLLPASHDVSGGVLTLQAASKGVWRESLLGGEVLRLRLDEVPVFESKINPEHIQLDLPALPGMELACSDWNLPPAALLQGVDCQHVNGQTLLSFHLSPDAEALEVVEVVALGEIQVVLRRRGAALLDESLQEEADLVVLPSGSRTALSHVIIDPGHGGKDPGAVSPWGRYEKDMVLAIGLELRKQLKKARPDLKVTMTRETDIFLSLSERSHMANRAQGDLFVSLHINAAQDRRAKGYEIYLLSSSRNEHARQVALRENATLDFEDDGGTWADGSNLIMATMAQSIHVLDSKNVAVLMAQELGKVAHRRRRQVQQANFQVLRGTSMPAVLVECGFITNETEHRFMRKPDGQRKLAAALCDAIIAYADLQESTVGSSR